MQIDPKQLGSEIAELVRAACDSAQAPVLARIKALEDRTPADGKDGINGKDGVDGKDAPPISAEQIADALKSMPDVLESVVKSWLAEHPPADGKDGVDGKDADPVSEEQIAKSVASHIALNPPPAGRDGRDGLPGLNGEDGRDGLNGKDGADGLSLKDFDVSLDADGRTLVMRLADGEREVSRSLKLPVVLDQGVFRDGTAYVKGDAVSYGGSLWIAQQDAPTDKPGDGSKQWRLAVKHGRDGKDGNEGKRGERGLPGMSSEEIHRRRQRGEDV